jgi:hypothetical protein
MRRLCGSLILAALLCTLLTGATIRIPPARVGPIRVQSAGVVSTGTAAYVNGSFSDAAIFAANWTNAYPSNGSCDITTNAGSLTVNITTGGGFWFPGGAAKLNNPITGDFDVSVDMSNVGENSSFNRGSFFCFYVDTNNYLVQGHNYTSWVQDGKVGGSRVLDGNVGAGWPMNVVLRVKRTGDAWSLYYKYRRSDVSWNLLGTTPNRAIGGTVYLMLMCGDWGSPGAGWHTTWDNLTFASGGPAGQY